ncbi:MAG: hypothetical protein GY793_02210 [Proteobacteria bacterium]|nr:hypothetical protein [Pseudomonadota bacterium]
MNNNIQNSSLIDSYGGKGASLERLKKNKFNVPTFFVISTDIFSNVLNKNSILNKLNNILAKVDVEKISSVIDASGQIKDMLSNIKIDEDVENDILQEFDKFNFENVSVRSSANVEDGEVTAWAGIFDSFLNITKDNLIDNVKKCWLSLYSPRAISYRIKNDLLKADVKVAVVVQEMVPSEVSGIGFSIDPVENDSNVILINVGFGLGELIVSGQITPDNYSVCKSSNVIEKEVCFQSKGLYKSGLVEFDQDKGSKQKLTDKQILEVAKSIKQIEDLYKIPIDIEFAYYQNKLHILQARPVTGLDKHCGFENLSSEEKMIVKEVNSYRWMTTFKNTGRGILGASIWATGVRKPIKNLIAFLPTEDVEINLKNEPFLRAFKAQKMEDSFATVFKTKIKTPELILSHLEESYSLLDQAEKSYPQLCDAIKDDDYLTVKNNIFDVISLYEKIEFFEAYINGFVMALLDSNKYPESEIQHILKEVNSWRNDMTYEKILMNSVRDVCHYMIAKMNFNFTVDDVINYLHVKEFKMIINKELSDKEICEIIDRRISYGYILLNLDFLEEPKVIDSANICEPIFNRIKEVHENIIGRKISGSVLKGQSILKTSKKLVADCVVINQESDLHSGLDLKDKILITTMTTPAFVPYLNNVRGVITDNGGAICHAAIISREYKIPCIIATECATQIFTTGDLIEMNLFDGRLRRVEAS